MPFSPRPESEPRAAHCDRVRPGRATLAALALVAALAGAASGSTFRTILVDDGVADWAGVAPVHVDPSGDHAGGPVDLGRLFIANDDRFVYLRFDIGNLLNLQGLPGPLRIHLDTDQSSATGYAVHGIGSDLLVECSPGGSGIRFYEQTASGFYAASLGHAALGAYQGPTVAATEFELRLLRGARLPIRGQAAFPGPGFRLALVAGADVSPDVPGSLSYAFATGTPAPPPDNDLLRADPKHVRLLTYNVRLDGLMGSDSLRFRRVLRAIQPDVIGFQELYNTAASIVARRLDRDLPLPGAARWTAHKGQRGQVTASRYPMTVDAAAPFRELATLIDLPDAGYDIDLYVINSHFKCCGSIGTSEDQQRQEAADAIIGWIREVRSPGPLALTYGTPIVHLGDLNLVGGPRPLVTLITGDILDESAYGPDFAPDWDGSGMERAAPVHSDAVAAYTWRSDGSSFVPGKLDYILYTGSVATPGNRFILNTLDMSPAKLAALGLQADDTGAASDHLPTVLDLLPEPAGVSRVPDRLDALVRLSLHPNPFAGSARVTFELATAAEVLVAVHDLAGRAVRELSRGRWPAGVHGLDWDGRDGRGRAVENGVYVVTLAIGGDGPERPRYARKLALVR